jgi:hypothetical protein
MTGICPRCGAQYPLSSVRGTRVHEAHCPLDGTALVGRRALACPVRGRYQFPDFAGRPRFFVGDCGRPRGHDGVCRSSSGHTLRAAPAGSLSLRAGTAGSYEVRAEGAFIGHLAPVSAPSHIRSGSARSAPAWRALCLDGAEEGVHQRRVDAMSALAWVNLGRPG